MCVLQNKTEKSVTKLPFIDLKSQQLKIRTKIDAAIKRVLDHGKYIMGPEVFELEQKLAAFCGAKYAISCSSGTDALLMVLIAKGVGIGDAVFIPSFTFPATPEVVALLGATPVFVDVDSTTYNMDPASLTMAIEVAKNNKLTPKAIITVDLFGEPANYPAITQIAHNNELWILADAAQSFGASLNGKMVGQLADATATSFFPAKPLGCYGDGGCVFTNDVEFEKILTSVRIHGKGENKYDNIRIGLNARLDTIQAAILLEKLKIFPAELAKRRAIAKLYNQHLADLVQTPVILPETESAWAQYTICLPENIDRAKLIAKLNTRGIPVMIYYDKPIHLQAAYAKYPTATNGPLAVAEALATKVLSLPMTPSLDLKIVREAIISST